MSKLNPNKQKAVTQEGGKGFFKSPEMELMNIATTCILQDTYYSSNSDIQNRVEQLLKNVSPLFVLKLATFTRNEMKLRSFPQMLLVHAAQMSKVDGSGKFGRMVRNYAPKIMKRADEPADVLSFWMNKYGNGKKNGLPNCLKNSISDCLSNFDGYQLSKYKGDKKTLSLKDVIRIVHPKPKNDEQSLLFAAITKDTISPPDTWEVFISKNGSNADSWNEIAPKMGTLALLRNLRNFEKAFATKAIEVAIGVFQNKERVLKSGILPYQWAQATEHISNKELIEAINTALNLSIDNVPEINSNTVVVVDHSGSMGHGISSTRYKANILAAMIYKKTPNCKVFVFGDHVKEVKLERASTVTNIMKRINDVECGHSTHITPVFDMIPSDTKNVIILSDMQTHDHYYGAFATWKKTHNNPDAKTFSVDLAGQSVTIAPERANDAFILSGWSERLIEFIGQSKEAMLEAVNAA